jgi:Predicted membrane protein
MEINPVLPVFGSESERNVLLVTYVLFVVGLFTGGLATIVGVVVCHIKRGETTDAALRSHYVWLIRTFWWSLLWTLLLWLAALTVILLVVLWPGLIVLGIWYIYRIVRGVLAFIERRPLPV